MGLFNEYYFQEKRVSLGRSFKNLFTSEKKFDVNTDKYSIFRQITNRGYEKFVDKISDRVEIQDWRKKMAAQMDLDKDDPRTRKDYLKKYKLKSEDRITQIYQGVLKGSNSKLPEGYEPIDISVYQTNLNGTIILLALENPTGDTAYFVVADGRGDNFFKSIAGMSISTFASLNKVNKEKDDEEDHYKSASRKEPEIELQPEPKEPEQTSDIEVPYYEKVDSIKDSIKDRDNDNWFGFVKLNDADFKTFIRKLKTIQKTPKLVNINKLGSFYKYEINPDETIYSLPLVKSNGKVENYIVYETNNRSNIKDLNRLIFGSYKLDAEDFHWIKSINISKLPSF